MNLAQEGKVREALEKAGADLVEIRGNTVKAYKGYFYKFGKIDVDFVKDIEEELEKSGIKYNFINSGDHWATFKGEAGVKRNSHFWAVFKIGELR
jgi:hypothetical protein